jgi:hypothetical protein
MIAIERPPGKCQAAYIQLSMVLRGDLPAPAREEAEQREHENHNQDDPENAHAV